MHCKLADATIISGEISALRTDSASLFQVSILSRKRTGFLIVQKAFKRPEMALINLIFVIVKKKIRLFK